MKELFFLALFVILAVMFAVAALIANYICAPKAETDDKKEIYECGMRLFSDCDFKIDFKYINYVIIFLIFDVETVFLFPFAVYFSNMSAAALCEAVIFISLLFFALLYAIKTCFAEENG